MLKIHFLLKQNKIQSRTSKIVVMVVFIRPHFILKGKKKNERVSDHSMSFLIA